MPARAPALDPDVHATFAPHAGGFGGDLLLWRRTVPPFADGESVTLLIDGEPRTVQALRLGAEALPELLDWSSPSPSPSVAGFLDLARATARLVERESLRPTFHDLTGTPRAAWRLAPDADERRVLVALVRRFPPVAFSGVASAAAHTPWDTARAFADALADALVRLRRPVLALPPGSWEADIEAALAGESALGRLAASPRGRRSLEGWNVAARAKESSRARLVLLVELPRTEGVSFRVRYELEVRESGGGFAGPLGAGAVWSGDTDAHLLADELAPLRAQLRDALHAVGQLIAPIEVSLASSAPQTAILTAEEAWALVSRQRSEVEALGCRVVVPPELERIELRFPRARVRVSRRDGAPDTEISLAAHYRVKWEVASEERTLSPAALRDAARHAPLASVDGRWLPMTAEAGERLARIAERAETDWTGPQALAAALAGEVRLPGDLADAHVVSEPGLLSLIDALGGEAEDVSVPAGLQASLRVYQQRGLSWLAHRTKLGLGALLADDMGLGKTVQLIALLVHLKERGAPGGPTLLACPASLVGNWEREIARFAPGLSVVRHHGGARWRDAAELKSRAGPHDVVLTTYGLIRRDSAMLAEVGFGTIVCDEAQNVKNAGAGQAKAIRAIPALRRIALTGTPVENRLTELWSLLEFLNPGLLGPLEKFRREIALPIERERDARAARWLRAATAPFLLRRLKSDPLIAPELPDKEIIKVFCSLTEEQATLYKQAVHESLAAIEGADGMERKGRVLKLLTELKQICNHPAQYLGDHVLAGRSGKFERAAEMLEEIAESGERVLIFTQYVEMGERLCEYLSQRLKVAVPFFHGGLSLPQRDALVQSFQQETGGPPVLVMSLRAGGVGLNLTRASHVLHYDRWWNPAVEDQATDRAHRIGQTRRVQVHHLIGMGTLEERIDKMLDDKRGLADAVVSGGESWLTEMSTDELRALVSLGSDAAVETLERFDDEAR